MCQSSSEMMKSNLVEGSSYQQAVTSQSVVLNPAGRSRKDRRAVSENLSVFHQTKVTRNLRKVKKGCC